MLLLNGYVFWAARLRFQVPEEAIERRSRRRLRHVAAIPSLARAVAAGIFEDGSTPDDDFAFGLERVLDGVEALITRAA